MHESAALRLEAEAALQQLLSEKDHLIERIANEGPKAALQWARGEAQARAARGEALPKYCDRLLSETTGSDFDEEERKVKKRRVTSPGGSPRGRGKLEPVSFVVPLGEGIFDVAPIVSDLLFFFSSFRTAVLVVVESEECGNLSNNK